MCVRILRQLTIIFAPAHHCFSTHFGEDRCCVSSIHSVVEAQAGERGPTLMTASKALFNVPAEYAERLQRFGWTILFIALLGAHVYLRESTTCYCTANDIVGKRTLRWCGSI
jgi:hypothetical protein